ncbi:hypothetical protein C1645_874137 [Glomus cerebriforme]|uniref:Uncharacterized protein n=1 Tax=Glomus cerebriforme TaxID=658196 RepID=A0A397T5A6_9GLOM|nr:hypothetical protein C1645_874137 [Glomus cerebriforme]
MNYLGLNPQSRKKGIYFDGHEREDVLQYRKKFLEVMMKYEKLMPAFIGGEIQMVLPELERLHILVTYDECQGKSIMVSEFLLETIGRLKLTDELAASYPDVPNEARKYYVQQLMAKDGLNAFNMNLNPGGKKPCMHMTYYGPNQTPQSMVFPHNHPKFPNQPKDFLAQKSQLQEEIEKHGHKCIFYPKYHCELNYIEMYWGATKRYTREHCNYTWVGLQQTVPKALDLVPLVTIRKYAQNQDIYRKGITGKMAEFAAKKYKSHRRLPPSTSVAGNETVSLADDIKKYDTAKLIEFLQGQGLGLSETAIKILEEEEIDGRAFLKMTEQRFRDYGMKGGPAVKLVEFAKECKEKKLKALASYKSLKEAKKLRSLVVDSLEAMRNEYVVAILHTAINITRDSTGEELSMRPEYEVIGDDSTGRVDFAIKKAENLICATEDKPERNLIEGLAQNIKQLENSCQTNLRKRKRNDDDDFDHLYGIVSTARDWHFLLYTPGKISQGSKLPFSIEFSEDALDKESCVKGLFEMESEIDLFRQENTRLMAKITWLESEKAELLKQVVEERAKHEAENAELRSRIEELEKGRIDTVDAIAEPLSHSKISEEKKNPI